MWIVTNEHITSTEFSDAAGWRLGVHADAAAAAAAAADNDINEPLIWHPWPETCAQQRYITSAFYPAKVGRGYCYAFTIGLPVSVCLRPQNDNSQICGRILTKFFGEVGRMTSISWLDFDGDPDQDPDPGTFDGIFTSAG